VNLGGEASGSPANVEQQAATDAAASGQERLDAQGGSPPLAFSPRRAGQLEDLGAQQQ
jgi:hypothetical protein